MTLGERVRAARSVKGWTQEDLSRETSIDRSMISQIENSHRSASASNLAALAQALEVDLAELTQLAANLESSRAA